MTEPYDGDPPSKLVEETTDYFSEWMERFKGLMEEARAEGLNTVVMIGGRDPLTALTHFHHSCKGDTYACMGMAYQFLQDKTKDQ